MTDFVGFHAWDPRIAADEFPAVADALASREGLELLRAKHGGAEREYGAEGARVAFFHDAEKTPPQIWAYIDRDSFRRLGQPVVARVFKGMSEATRPVLARSFSPQFHGVIESREASAGLQFIDWFQYFPPAMVARIGLEALERVPIAQREMLPDGACVLWLPGSPLDGLEGRTAAAEALGVTLRPLIGRNPESGEPFVMPWH